MKAGRSPRPLNLGRDLSLAFQLLAPLATPGTPQLETHLPHLGLHPCARLRVPLFLQNTNYVGRGPHPPLG